MPDSDTALRLPEILAPAGDLVKLEAALAWGADAVYLAAGDYGLRAAHTAFSPEDLTLAVHLAHQVGAAVRVTLNILARPGDLAPPLDAAIDAIRDAGADAVIVADPAVLLRVRRRAPELRVHISTQMSVSNPETARFWADQGAERIVLARELTLDEIAAIHRELGDEVELEAFVHGSMCVAWSGRCLLSDAMTGRGANRGACAGSCRWSYALVEEKRPDEFWPVEEDGHGTYLLSSRDLCLIEHVPQLIEAGIAAFKIEGRARSAAYAAVTTGAYRRAVDQWAAVGTDGWHADPDWLRDLESLPHRPYDTGFFFARPEQEARLSPAVRQLQPAVWYGRVLEDDAFAGQGTGLACLQTSRLRLGERVTLLRPDGSRESFTVTRILDEEGREIPATPHPMMRFRLPDAPAAPEHSLLRSASTAAGEAAGPPESE